MRWNAKLIENYGEERVLRRNEENGEKQGIVWQNGIRGLADRVRHHRAAEPKEWGAASTGFTNSHQGSRTHIGEHGVLWPACGSSVTRKGIFENCKKTALKTLTRTLIPTPRHRIPPLKKTKLSRKNEAFVLLFFRKNGRPHLPFFMFALLFLLPSSMRRIYNLNPRSVIDQAILPPPLLLSSIKRNTAY